MNHIMYEDLNNAKEKVLYLLNLKYSENVDDFNNDSTTNSNVENSFDKIISMLEFGSQSIFQMFTFIRKKNTRRAEKYFRNVNAYVSFNDKIFSLSKSMKNINRLFQTIIKDIGFVEPENITLYKEAYETFNRHFDELNDIIKTNGEFKIEHVNEENEIERQNLIDEIKTIDNEKITLDKYNQEITNNYNYTSANIKTNKKGHDFTEEKKKSAYLFEEHDDNN